MKMSGCILSMAATAYMLKQVKHNAMAHAEDQTQNQEVKDEEDVLQKEIAEDDADQPASLYEEVKGADNIRQMLQTLDNRFIFLKHGKEKPQHMEAVEELADHVD